MDTQPLVSIIIPTYNGERWLTEAVGSIFAQTRSDWELIIVDDGSTDGTRRMIELLVQQDVRIRAIYKANGGVASARNMGLRTARGAYLAFLDQDDLFMPNKLEQQVSYLELHPEVDLVYSHFLMVDMQGNATTQRPLRPSTTFRELWETFQVHTSSFLVRTRIVNTVGFLNEQVGWSDEVEWILRIARVGTIGFQDGVVSLWRKHGQNTSRDFLRCYQHTLEALYSIGPSKKNGVTAWMFRRRLARLHYRLGRLEWDAGRFGASTQQFWNALRLYPFVGLLFREGSSTPHEVFWLMIKPYGALVLSSLRACLPWRPTGCRTEPRSCVAVRHEA